MLKIVQHSWKTTSFLKATFCEYCGDLLWGFSEQGAQCSVCNFISHHKCMHKVASSCHLAEPQTERSHIFLPFTLTRSTFCNLCRNLIIVIAPGLKCDVCRYIIHVECEKITPKNCLNGFCTHKLSSSSPSSSILASSPSTPSLPSFSPPRAPSSPPSTSSPSTSSPSSSPSLPAPSLSPLLLENLQAHHWMEGNTPQTAVCHVCGLGCATVTCLMNFRCSWCKYLAHASCLSRMHPVCNGGTLSNALILPNAALAPTPPNTVIELMPEALPVSPVFVFVNSKSGGQQGPRLLHKLRYLLNQDVQVFELIPNGPGPGLAVIQNYINSHPENSNSNSNSNSNLKSSSDLSTKPNLFPTSPTKAINTTISTPTLNSPFKTRKLNDTKRENKKTKEKEKEEAYEGIRIVVCGGDGTAGWLVQAMAERGMSVPLAIIPLGTGNDLARTLGWGPGYNGENVMRLIQDIEGAKLRTLDRWNVSITPFDGKDEAKTMTNYFSIGVDAKVALSFHLQREASPDQFKNRFVNFLWYTKFGASAMFNGCENLSQEIALEVDGTNVPLPSKLQGLIVVNLPSYAAGLNMWTGTLPSGTQKQSISDGLVEIVGVLGAGHIAQIQTNLSEGLKIAQGRDIKILFLKKEGPYPVQVDGEPWSQDPGTITISRRDQVPVLMRQEHELEKSTSQVIAS